VELGLGRCGKSGRLYARVGSSICCHPQILRSECCAPFQCCLLSRCCVRPSQTLSEVNWDASRPSSFAALPNAGRCQACECTAVRVGSGPGSSSRTRRSRMMRTFSAFRSSAQCGHCLGSQFRKMRQAFCSRKNVHWWCAKQSSVVLVNCEVFIVVKDRKPCRELCGGWEQSCPSKPELPKARAAVFRELVSASLDIIESGQPFTRGEASIGPEATIMCRGRTLRGERRQRAPKEPSGTWEARHRVPAARQEQPWKGSHNLPSGGVVASERPIVAVKFRLESGWSQGALATVTLSQKPLELIG
jgi:hypothetical protein